MRVTFSFYVSPLLITESAGECPSLPTKKRLRGLDRNRSFIRTWIPGHAAGRITRTSSTSTQMDTTKLTAVSNRLWIRASKEAAEALPLQEKDWKPKALRVVIFVYLPLNLCLLYLIQGHLSTRKILPYSLCKDLNFCAEPTKVPIPIHFAPKRQTVIERWVDWHTVRHFVGNDLCAVPSPT